MNIFIKNEKLSLYGINSGQTILKSRRGRHTSGRTVYKMAKGILLKLERLNEELRDKTSAGKEAEWLSDNMYIVRREAAAAAEDFKHAGRLSGGGDSGAAVLSAARDLVRSGLGYVDGERTAIFLEGFQQSLRLSEKELMLIAPSIRLELLFYLYESITGGSEAEQAAESVFKTLFRLASTDLYRVIESVNLTERILRRDPSGDYQRMDIESRAAYRRELLRLAEAYGMEEAEAAQHCIELAQRSEGYKRHVGYYIYKEPLGNKAPKKPYGAYIGINVLVTLIITLFIALSLNSIYLFLFTLLPVSEAVKYILDRLILRLKPPRCPPMLELSCKADSGSRTLCVTALMLSSPEAAAKAVNNLEEYRLLNRNLTSGLYFGLLADLPEAKTQVTDKDNIALEAAEREINKLNEKYGGGFCLILRRRSYSERDKIYRGWERKRGAVMELIKLLKEGKSGAELICGETSAIDNISYVIILDSDTRLTSMSACELIGTISHPLNKPVTDRVKKRLVHGSGIIGPKVGVDLSAANSSDFARIFAGQGGLDPYGSSGSDLYQDIFSEGSFAGKGILSVEAAYDLLTARFPLNTLLSHDLIEGEYLRCTYAGNIELIDGFPASLLSYYERQHRWIRGDWQTLRWLGSKVRDEAGEPCTNPISPLGKWKIFDNLRRSLVPVMTFLALFICCLMGTYAAVITALTVLISLALKVIINSLRKPELKNKTYKTGVFTAAASDFMQFFILTVLLPYTAYVNLSAILLSLYRQFISKRNLLKWITAAECDSKKKHSLGLYYKKMFICPLVGVLGIVLTAYAPAIALFILWLFAPALGCALSRPRRNENDVKISSDNRAFLLHCAKDIWRYFETYLTSERNWLPPDNVQEEPVETIAERSSPTNIGLALLTILTAYDLSFIDKKKALRLIENMLQTIEELPKFKGHLYNWYDIKNLLPLRPEYISTVDSGNLIGCLLVLYAGLMELGEAGLAERVKLLADNMDLGFLYDTERRLMRIGYDMDAGAGSDCWYDLLESEARIASYIAIARGEADRRHWRRLGRILTQKNGVCGLASWTGTMFEYFMPCLFMPSYRNSLLHESLEFCLYAQKQRTAQGVWGISESAFYSFDACMNYSYKAHGVQSAALKRGMDRDLVISPYSTFLTLNLNPNACIRNLKRLRRLGLEGRFGYYEAADFTGSRIGSAEYEKVRCFMTHHLAMSIVAINNALKQNIMVKRFMSHPELRAYSELLQEKGPVGQLIRTDKSYRAEDRPERMRSEGWSMGLRDYDLEQPACFLMSNGSYSILFSELGQSSSKCGDRVLTAFEKRRFSERQGVSFYALYGSEFISLQPGPEYRGSAEYSCEFTGKSFRQFTKSGQLEFRISTFTVSDECGEQRRILLRNRGSEAIELTLICYFEPVLTEEASYNAHTAFSKLSLETEYINGRLLFKRRGGGKDRPCCLALACTEAFSYDTDRVAALGRGGLRSLPFAVKRTAGSTSGAVADPCCLLRIKINLKPGEKKELSLALALCAGAEEALLSADRVLKQNESDNNFFFDAASALNMTGREMEEAMSLLSSLVYENAQRKELYKDYGRGVYGRGSLWRYGISGDVPILLAEADENLGSLMRYYGFISRLGFELDLVIIIQDSGQYGRPEYSAALEEADKLGLGGRVNRKAGIHLIWGGESELDAVRALADLYISQLSGFSCDRSKNGGRRTGLRSNVDFFLKENTDNNEKRLYSYTDSGSFSFTQRGRLGPYAWSNIITNGRLGYIATDGGTGSLWLSNSRENRVNRWVNDPLAAVGSERLELVRGIMRYSLFGGNVEYGLGWAKWTLEEPVRSELTAFILPDTDARVFILKLNDIRPGDKLSYFTQLVLGSEDEGDKTVAVRAAEGEVTAVNGDKHIKLSCSHIPEQLYMDELDYMTGGKLRGGKAGFGAVYPAENELVLTLGFDDTLSILNPDAAEKALEQVKAYWREKTGFIRIKSPDKELDNYINGWALYQVVACRLLGRNSIYQSGGAFGFRDQLQDVCALIDTQPELARAHIIGAAGHQYLEGDVQHWWHEPRRGVRTRCSDDLLWLPYAVALYIKKTGDRSILSEEAPFLSSPPLEKGEHDRYENPELSEEEALEVHCRRAIELVLERGTGRHRQLLIGSGDWNDGFDNMGSGAESVWLTWFAALVLKEYGEVTGSSELVKAASELGASADSAFDSGQYIRAFYGDGSPLGAEGEEACEIDSIAQSFSVISSFGDRDKSLAAIKKAVERLYSGGITRLFDPPFDKSRAPGYIGAYLPGVRENGGQYTHAAIWLALACLKAGEINTGYAILSDLLPFNKDTNIYKAEPYVLPADVYTNPYLMGRGGWTWYTGAAGWYLRVVVEELLGLKLVNGELRVEPKLPEGWDGFDAEYTALGQKYVISVSDKGKSVIVNKM
jgi:cyclic beta-1,2-glucan synthetase